MSPKRPRKEEGNFCDDDRMKKPPSFKSVVLEVMNFHRLQNFLVSDLEPLIRRVVKEEVHSAIEKYVTSITRTSVKEMQPSESRSMGLQFSNSISLPVFTGTRIDGEGCCNIEVALVDSNSRAVISHGLNSFAKVEIVVLEGDFDGDDRGDWSHEEFKANVVRERQGKKPLLTGDVIITLRDGKGSIADIIFTDNSSWTRSRKFRLGARLIDDTGELRVREAISEPFVVRDHRGELYKKHYPPSLGDEVWRLEKIGKGGAFHRRLKKEGINTVQEFLIQLCCSPTQLRNILGTGMSTKMWEITVDHARTCVLDKKLFLYSTCEGNSVVFNVVGQATGLHSNGVYTPADGFSESQKATARQMAMEAFSDRAKIITIDDESSLEALTPAGTPASDSSSTLPAGSSYHHSLVSQTISQLEQRVSSSLDYLSPLVSIGGVDTLDDCFHPLNRALDQHLSYQSGVEFLTMSSEFCGNDELYLDTDGLLPGSEIELSDDLRSVDAVLPRPSGWSVILSVLRWCYLMKRTRTRKGRAQERPRYVWH